MADLVRCTNCPGTIKLVGSKGPIDSPLVIVGESPGWEEVRDGKPFIGPSGKIVDHALKQHPDIPEPFFTNAAICFPGTSSQKNQDRTIAATQCCHDRLIGEISAHPRKVILALGNHALWSLTNDYSHKITQVRGKLYASEHASVGVIAAVHPAFLMRGGGSLRQFMGDFNYALELLKGRDIRKPVIPKYALVESMDQLRWLAGEIASKEYVAADSETGGYDGFDHLRDRILCSGYCWDPGIVYVVPEGLTRESNILYENKTRFIWQNGKFDAKFFRAGGVSKVRVDEDTMLLSYALDERGGIHDLEQIASDLISAPNWKFMIQPYLDAEKKGKPKGWNQPGFECVPREILYDYMSRDISGTFQCFPILRRQVQLQPRLEMLYTKTLMPMSDYLTEVEENGMGVDLTQRDSNSVRLLAQIDQHRSDFVKIAQTYGVPDINLNSPKQLQPFLQNILKLKAPDTAADTLEKLIDDHPCIRILLKYRKVAKAESTYVRNIHTFISLDNRVHQTYKIHGTTTGRLACSDPNLLNIPRDPALRNQFVAKDGCIYLEVDTSQAELRVLAELSGDEELAKIYLTAGMSLHDEVRAELFGHPKDYDAKMLEYQLFKFRLTHETRFDPNGKDILVAEQKMRAKNVNFGIPYGITAIGLAEQIDDTVKEAQKYLDIWYKKFKGAHTFILKCRQAVVLGQQIGTPFGRYRRFGVVSKELVQEMQNQAANFPEQSIASDFVIHTALEMRRRGSLPKYQAKIVNTVYDSILYELPNDDALIKGLAAETLEVLPKVAKEWGFVKIPIIGEAKIGRRWGSLLDMPDYYKLKAEGRLAA